jgi:WD40 repeat protein
VDVLIQVFFELLLITYVESVAWSSCGQYIITGSDDTQVCIWDWENNGALKASFETGHTANIFCAKFIPFMNNSRVVTCAGYILFYCFVIFSKLWEELLSN